ncbi:MAG: YkgJ family cysteine cluster protein, partial [Actinomycetota bacterium]|nr:YkgJ family cysteine cluster protein [Actinomycetota bacterium]
HGHCPMLVDNRCSIYEHRPMTCRTYDCRVFPAAGVGLDDDGDDDLVARQARRWRFSFPTDVDTVEYHAVRAAAASLGEDPEARLPASEIAAVAIETHEAFLGRDDPKARPRRTPPAP